VNAVNKGMGLHASKAIKNMVIISAARFSSVAKIDEFL
jgi:hypothetical protein